jgi:hypothetical protein
MVGLKTFLFWTPLGAGMSRLGAGMSRLDAGITRLVWTPLDATTILYKYLKKVFEIQKSI